MVKPVSNLDCVAQRDVVGANEIGPLQRDEQRPFGRPGADPLDGCQLSDRLVIGETAELGLG
jgi:hypothetical protein